VLGIVKDGSGSVVGNANVTLTNVDQARHWETRTGNEGQYVLVQIPPATMRWS